MLLLFVGLVTVYVGAPKRPAVHTAWMWMLWFAVAIVELLFVSSMKRAHDLRWHPLPLRIALNQPHWPFIARPAIALWWIMHWALILLLGDTFYNQMSVNRMDDDHVALEYALLGLIWTLRVFIAFSAAYASNVYLLMATTAIRPSGKMAAFLWQCRFPLDVSLAVAVLLARGQLPSPLKFI